MTGRRRNPETAHLKEGFLLLLQNREERRKEERVLRDALQEAGEVFVKLGQMLSTRSDLLPPTVLAEIAGHRMYIPTLDRFL